jgi:glycosyltransferase involved in cell wall biosynthesis
MKKTPLISIITVVYNGEKYLNQTIESVINQTHKNIEYIIIDGGSTDGTIEIIKKYEKHINYWISEPDKGLYDAMNKGIQIANGDLIGMINSDDWYELDAVETVVNTYLKNSTNTIFHADRYDVYPNRDKRVYKFNTSKFKFRYIGMTYSHPSMFISKEEYKKHLYNTSLRVYSDYQFTLEAFLKDPNKFVHINKPIVNFRLGGTSGQISFFKNLQEGFSARRNAGLNLFQSILALFCKALIELVKNLRNK